MKIDVDSILALFLKKKAKQAMSTWFIWHIKETEVLGFPHSDRYQQIQKMSNLCK